MNGNPVDTSNLAAEVAAARRLLSEESNDGDILTEVHSMIEDLTQTVSDQRRRIDLLRDQLVPSGRETVE
mgnify:FL=1